MLFAIFVSQNEPVDFADFLFWFWRGARRAPPRRATSSFAMCTVRSHSLLRPLPVCRRWACCRQKVMAVLFGSQLGMHSVEGSCQHARWRGSSHMHPEGCGPNAVYVLALFGGLFCPATEFIVGGSHSTRRVLTVYRDNGTSSYGRLHHSSRGRRHSY